MRIQKVLLKICEILCVVLGDTDEVESPQKEAPKELTIDVPQFGGKAESTERPILAQKPGPQCVRRIERCVLLPELIVRDKSVYWIPHPGNKLDLVAKKAVLERQKMAVYAIKLWKSLVSKGEALGQCVGLPSQRPRVQGKIAIIFQQTGAKHLS